MDQQRRRAIARNGKALSARIWQWDPLAISPPEDEYDRLAWPLLRMLQDNTPADEIARWLDDALFRFYDPDTAPNETADPPVSASFVNDTITWFANLENP